MGVFFIAVLAWPRDGDGVSFLLNVIVEFHELDLFAGFVLDGFADKEVGQLRIFWQYWAMQISADTVFITTAFGLVFPIIASAGDNFAEWFNAIFERSEARMVFVSDNFAKAIAIDDNVAN